MGISCSQEKKNKSMKNNQTNSESISSKSEHLEKDNSGTRQETEQKAKNISSKSEHLEKDNLGTSQDTEQKAKIITSTSEYLEKDNLGLLYLNLLLNQMLSKLSLNYHIFTKPKIPIISYAENP